MTRRSLAAFVALVCCGWSLTATEPDAATRRWWSHVRVLADDRMQGRDTGSPGYQKAADYVVSQFKRVGLSPSGDSGYYQAVPLHAVRFRTNQSAISLTRPNGEIRPLRWQHQISLVPRTGVPENFDATLAFSGWQIPDDLNVQGRILVALAPPRFVPGPRGYAQTPRPGYWGTLVIETAAGPEPVRWPSFSSILMTPANVPLPAQPPGAPSGFNFNPAAAEELFEGSGHTALES